MSDERDRLLAATVEHATAHGISELSSSPPRSARATGCSCTTSVPSRSCSSRWSSLDSFELIREGVDEREGLGAVRLYRTGKKESYEEIVALVADRQ